MSQENAALGRRWFEQVWNQGNIDAADELASADCKAYGHAPNDQPIGIPQFKEFARRVQAAFPDIRVYVEETISEGDRSVLRWRCEMTHTGEFMGTAASGKKATVRGISIMRFKDGKVVEAWDNWDQLGLLTQIGAVPPTALAA
jgi:steroid delta-isomerase-like uncharacterized protein